jgi:PAS domain S-box-containing protein
MGDAESKREVDSFIRLHIASSQVSRTILRSNSREELLNDVTRILVESGGFAMAFIAWHDPESQQLLPVARFGDDGGYADHIRIYTDDRPEGRGPGGTAFRAGVPYVCNDFEHDPHTMPWRTAAGVSGWLASAGLPILISGTPRGLLSVYAREAGAFGASEVGLLSDVAGDIAFGLEHIEAERLRRQAEEALSASDLRLKLAVDASGIGTFDWDMLSGRLVWDSHHERIFGFAPGEFDGTYDGFKRRVHPDDRPAMHRAFQDAIKARSTCSQECRVVWPDGSIHWVVSRGEFSYNDAGVPVRMIGAVLDVTERIRNIEALHESEERLRLATSVSQVGIFDHDHMRETIHWSREERQLFGVGPDEAVDMDLFLSRVHPEDREGFLAAVQREYDPAGDGLLGAEYRVLRPDGTVRWAFTRAQTTFDGAGATRHRVRTIGASVDITERKQIELALRVKDHAIEYSSTAFALGDPQGIMTYVNPAFLRLWGYEDKSEVLGRSSLEFWESPEEAAIALTALPEKLHWLGELRGRRKNGATFDVQVSTSLILDAGGNPVCIQANFIDITGRKQAEARLFAAHAELEAANADLEQRVLERSRELALSEERMRMAAEGAGLGAYSMNFESGEFYWSPEFKKLHGLAPDEPLVLDEAGVPIVVHPDDRNAFGNALAQANDPRGDGLLRPEYRVIYGDGSVHWLAVYAHTRFEGGRGARRRSSRAGVVIDITDRKKSEQALVRAHEQLALAMESTGLGLWDWKVQTGEMSMNDRWAAMLGYSTTELEQSIDVWRRLCHPEDLAKAELEIQAQFAGITPFYQSELRMRHKDGHWALILSCGKVVERNSEGQPLRMIGTHLDISERKEREDALREAKEALTLTIEAAQLGTWDWHADTGKVTVNARWAEMLGYTVEELAPVTALFRPSFTHPDDLPKDNALVQKLMDGLADSFEDETRMRHKDGHWVHILTRGRATGHAADGRPTRLTGIDLDVTELRRVQDALQAAQAELALAVEGSGVGVWNYDLETGAGSVNDRYAEMFGYTLDELAPVTLQTAESLAHPDDVAKLREARLRHFAGLTPVFEGEWRMRHKDGRWVHILGRGKVTARNGADRPIRYSGTNLDVSSLKEAEEKLRTFSQVVGQSPVVVIITTPERVIEYVNSAFSERTGYSLAEVLGKTPSLLKSNVHPREFYDQFDETLRRGESWRGELCDRTKDGALVWLSAVISPIRNERGEVIHFVQISQDVTQQKQAREELRLAKEAAEAANHAKSSFLANMSHEIRTPLNAILGYAQLLRRDPSLPEQTASQIEIINKSGEHLMNLISDILEMSKIEVGRVSVAATVFDLRSMISDVAEMFRARAAERSIEFSLAQNEALPRVVRADQGKIRQVLVNLLSNAVKFTDRGRVEMRCDAREADQGSHLLSVEVEDTGAGISEQEMGRLFHHFEQTSSGKRLQMGTGLGLAISREFARLMGGDITVSSQEGRGSIFRFRVPVVDVVEQVPVRPQSSRRVRGLQPGQPPLRVLIADDYAGNREWVKSLLLLIGAEVREAANGEEAFSVWQQWKPPLVLMDLRMPVLDGLEATRRIKAQPDGEKTVILALTAAVFQEDRIAAVQAGASDLIGKPLKEEVLFEKIQEYLGVDFVYEDGPEPNGQAAMSTSAGRRKAVTALPIKLRAALSEAILDGDSGRIDSLISETASHNPAVAAYMRKLAEQYDYEALSDLVKLGETV